MNSELQNCQQTEPCTVEEIRNSLEQSEKGKVYNTAANYKRVLQYDPLLKGAIRKNLLTERIDIVKPLGWYRDSPTLTDAELQSVADEAVHTLAGIVGKSNTALWEQCEHTINSLYTLQLQLVKLAYLRGAEDREKMLR